MPPSQKDLNLLLCKVSQFVKVATREIDTLQDEVATLHQKEASENLRIEKYAESLKKAAQALYNSDFLTDDRERRQFLRKAAEDPSYLSSIIVKVCNAADVSLIGSPARVAVKKAEEFDPIKARAFGWDNQTSSLLDDI